VSPEQSSARLIVRQTESGSLLVGMAGDWIAHAGLPGIDAVEKELASSGAVKVLEFDTAGLGRWNSGLMTFVLKCHEMSRS
jgi:phospholipid/cholesterol/gamma-HCH transport system permease protein